MKLNSVHVNNLAATILAIFGISLFLYGAALSIDWAALRDFLPSPPGGWAALALGVASLWGSAALYRGDQT